MPTINLKNLSNGWCISHCSDSDQDFPGCNDLFASVVDAYLFYYPYRQVFELKLPSGVDEDKLEEQAIQYFNLEES